MIVLQQIIRQGVVMMAKKQKYRIRNWKEYNKALVNRGSLTVWFDADSAANWKNDTRTGKRGRP